MSYFFGADHDTRFVYCRLYRPTWLAEYHRGEIASLDDQINTMVPELESVFEMKTSPSETGDWRIVSKDRVEDLESAICASSRRMDFDGLRPLCLHTIYPQMSREEIVELMVQNPEDEFRLEIGTEGDAVDSFATVYPPEDESPKNFVDPWEYFHPVKDAEEAGPRNSPEAKAALKEGLAEVNRTVRRRRYRSRPPAMINVRRALEAHRKYEGDSWSREQTRDDLEQIFEKIRDCERDFRNALDDLGETPVLGLSSSSDADENVTRLLLKMLVNLLDLSDRLEINLGHELVKRS